MLASYGLACLFANAATNVETKSPAETQEAKQKKDNDWYQHVEDEAKAGRGKGQVAGLISILDDPASDRKEEAAQLLSVIGTQGVDAVPSLMRRVNDSDFFVRLRCIQALGDIGPAASPAIPALIRLLHDPDWAIVNSAIYSLGRIGPKASVALPPLQQVLLLPKSSQRYAALIVGAHWAIANITRKPGLHVLALLPMLNEPDDDSIDSFPRTEAMRGLADLWPASKPALPQIGEILLNQKINSTTRDDAARTLQVFIDPKAIPYLLRAATEDPEFSVRESAIKALVNNGAPKGEIERLRKDSNAKLSAQLWWGIFWSRLFTIGGMR
jgi:HEAT repeat protein